VHFYSYMLTLNPNGMSERLDRKVYVVFHVNIKCQCYKGVSLYMYMYIYIIPIDTDTHSSSAGTWLADPQWSITRQVTDRWNPEGADGKVRRSILERAYWV
jgi:hypothetical protein